MGTLNGSPVAVPDDYTSLAALLGTPQGTERLTEGFLQAQVAGITIRFGDPSTPPTATGGLTLAAGAGIGLGPVLNEASAWPLARIWVRETNAGGGATLSALGVVHG